MGENATLVPAGGGDRPGDAPDRLGLGGLSEEERRVVRGWVRVAEDFVALEVVAYLSQFFVQFRNLALFLTAAPLLLLLAVTSYPFHPQRLWLICIGVLVVTVLGGIVRVFIGMERDAVVSRIFNTTPGRLNLHWSFLANVVAYAVPLLGVLAVMSTDMADLIHSLIDPVLQVLR